MKETIVCDVKTSYAYGKVFPGIREARRYMRQTRVVAAAGYILAVVFAALWIYERWIF